MKWPALALSAPPCRATARFGRNTCVNLLVHPDMPERPALGHLKIALRWNVVRFQEAISVPETEFAVANIANNEPHHRNTSP